MSKRLMRSPERQFKTPSLRAKRSNPFRSIKLGLGCVVAILLAVTPVFSPLAIATNVDCLDTGAALAYWQPIREQAATTELTADELAIELVSCLGSSSAELRDRIGYELFTYWLRQEKLSDETRSALLIVLSANVADTSADNGLRRSFSALILAEVMRSDAISAFMDDGERQTLLDTGIAALRNESDFRGLEPDIGWVHPVAHLSDLLWRFALHPATTAEQAREILGGVKSKVAPTGVAWSFNEGDRLARVVAMLIRKELLPAEFVGAWIAEFETPQSMEKWSSAFQSQEGMAELHNTKQFLRALSDQLNGEDIDPAIAEPLAALVQGFTQLI